MKVTDIATIINFMEPTATTLAAALVGEGGGGEGGVGPGGTAVLQRGVSQHQAIMVALVALGLASVKPPGSAAK